MILIIDPHYVEFDREMAYDHYDTDIEDTGADVDDDDDRDDHDDDCDHDDDEVVVGRRK